MKKIFNFLTILVMASIAIVMQSCSNSEEEKRAEFAQIVEQKSAVDAMNELYIAADGEIESLARMLQTTPSVIDRIRKGETNPTQDFEEKYKEVLVYYNINDRSFSRLQSALDEEYGWYDSVLDFPFHHPWWFWGVNIIIILILAFKTLDAIWPLLIEMLVFLIAWIASLCCSPNTMEDKYTDSINPVMEQLK